jgi:hypothetical protein
MTAAQKARAVTRGFKNAFVPSVLDRSSARTGYGAGE